MKSRKIIFKYKWHPIGDLLTVATRYNELWDDVAQIEHRINELYKKLGIEIPTKDAA
jgi:hypothetical protein